MRITRRSRYFLRTQSIALALVVLTLAGLAAWASVAWTFASDWSYGHRNGLTAASRGVLATLAGPAIITAFVPPHTGLARQERRLLAEYTSADPRIEARFANPDLAPARLKRLGITTAGELYVEYRGRGEKLDDVSESGITNALLRLSRNAAKKVVFVTGHGEADPEGDRNYDLGTFGKALEKQGFELAVQNLAVDPRLRKGTALVVVAGPQQAYLPAELADLRRWLDRGGSLLWLRNPGPDHGLGALAGALGVKLLDGTIVDMTTHAYGIDDPTALVISDYGASPITRDFRLNTLFPDATGFEIEPQSGWDADTFVASRHLPQSWLMTGGPKDGTILYRPGTDVAGPVPIAVGLTRPAPSGHGEQRAAVIGDTDFLTNQFLANAGNENLGLKLFNWLTGEDRYVDIAPARAPDRRLALSRVEQAGIGFGFLAGLPLVFLGTAFAMWLRRRRR